MTTTEARGFVASYLVLRTAIGWIGMLLPVVLVVGDVAFTSSPLPNSLSDYYYTPMRNILVGSLSVLGVFLVLYDVGVLTDRWVTNVSGAGILGVAFFPGSPPIPHLSTSQEVIGGLHVFFAAVALIGLAVTMWRFSLANSDGPGTAAPPHNAAIFYRASAGVMLGFMILSGVAVLLPQSVQDATFLLFITEALAIITFGVSWLVKGTGLEPLRNVPSIFSSAAAARRIAARPPESDPRG